MTPGWGAGGMGGRRGGVVRGAGQLEGWGIRGGEGFGDGVCGSLFELSAKPRVQGSEFKV